MKEAEELITEQELKDLRVYGEKHVGWIRGRGLLLILDYIDQLKGKIRELEGSQ